MATGAAEADTMKRRAEFNNYVKSLLGKYATGKAQTDLYVLRELLAGKDDDTLRKVGDLAVAAGLRSEKEEAYGSPGTIQILGGDERKAAIEKFRTELTRDAEVLNNPEGIADYNKVFESTIGSIGLSLQLVWDDVFLEYSGGVGPSSTASYSVAPPPRPVTREAVADVANASSEVPPLVAAPSDPADVDAIRAGNQQGLAGADGAGGDGNGSAGGTVGGSVPPLDDTLGEPGPRQIPGGAELWKVDGKAVYLAYTIPGTDTKMVWLVEDPKRLDAIFGGNVPAFDKELTRKQFHALSPWNGGLSAEIVNTSEDPWQVFLNKWEKATELRPWLADPKFQAVAAVAYLEGREPTLDELQETDWWNDHTADERAWMEKTATAGTGEVERLREDASKNVQEALRKAGMNNVPKHLADYIAEQRLTGKWSETYTNEQVRKLSDPYAPDKLDKGLLAMIRDPDLGSTVDARAIAGGKDTLKARIKEIFGNARVDLAKHGDGTSVDPEQRLDRLAQEVLSGVRTLTDIRQSVDILATKTPGGRPGGLDVNVEGEDRVRNLLREWVGPAVAAGYSDAWIAEQAGLLRNDPDYEQTLVEKLQAARMGAFGNWEDPTLRYEDIAPIARSLFSRVWGQTPDETDPLFMDVVNMQDQNEAARKLRQEGISKGVGKVVDDALAGLSETAIGQQVIRSTV